MTDDGERWRKRWEGWYGSHEDDYRDWLGTRDCAENREALARWALAHDGIMGDAYSDMAQRNPNAALAWTATLLHAILNGNPTGTSLPTVLSYAGDDEDGLDDAIWLMRHGWMEAYTMPDARSVPDTFDDRLTPVTDPEDLRGTDPQRVWMRHTYPEERDAVE